MDADERAIRDLVAEWFEATASGDSARVLALMADDAVFLTLGRPPFGREAFEAAAGQPRGRIECGGELEEVMVVGDVAYTRGKLAVSVTPPAGGEPMTLAGYTLSVFRKQPDGRWLLARDANLLTPVEGAAPSER
jgi:uncharacterized protein (TIGR02246 family)